MPKTMHILSPRKVQTETRPGTYCDGGNLYLVVEPGGAKRWAFIFQWAGRRREMGLGGLKSVSLAEARDAAENCRRLCANDIDPILNRRQSRSKGQTFGDFAPKQVAVWKPQWRNAKHVYQWEQSVNIDAASLHAVALSDVNTDHILAVLTPIWSQKPETANRTRQRLEKLLDAARVAGHRTGENPARWKGYLEHLLPKRQRLQVSHHPAMPFADMAAFIGLLRQRPALSARALEFTILTAARTSEVLGARWSEIDLGKAIWTVPAVRMKGKVEHRVPLSKQALNVLQALKSGSEADGEFIFQDQTTRRTLSNMAMRALMKRMGMAQFAVHGFPSTFRDWAGEETDFAYEVTETALAHLVGSEVQRAYRRGDALEKRRDLMQAWATYCVTPRPVELAQAA